MKKISAFLLACILLAGCGRAQEAPSMTEPAPSDYTEPAGDAYESRFEKETVIRLSQGAMDVTGVNSWSVFMSKDIVYYEDRETYDSGNPYGEGEDWERHSMDEAASHLVINITAPGAYRITGKLSAGQIRVDLGDGAYEDENAVVELILDGADITCTVAPAILFLNVYECDGNWSKDTAGPDVDTGAAGANLILVGENSVSGSHVAKVYKDKKGEKKLWKQDSAIYSYMSMNVYGPGKLDLTADNEGMGTELHLTIHSGEIAIRSGNDGINTNEDGVSVTAIHGGTLYIAAGLAAEGDGIDSNGYLVIHGGTVISAAHPASDAGLDSTLGSFIHGGTVLALGSAMDWAESESGQVTINLQFDANRQGPIAVTREDGTAVFEFDPGIHEFFSRYQRPYQGAVISCGGFRQGETYHVYQAGELMAYTGTDVVRGPGGFGGPRPEGEMPPMPEDGFPGMDEGEMPPMPEGQQPPDGQRPAGGRAPRGEASTRFYMQDTVNFFSGLSEAA